jgi:hypothetical protein
VPIRPHFNLDSLAPYLREIILAEIETHGPEAMHKQYSTGEKSKPLARERRLRMAQKEEQLKEVLDSTDDRATESFQEN